LLTLREFHQYEVEVQMESHQMQNASPDDHFYRLKTIKRHTTITLNNIFKQKKYFFKIPSYILRTHGLISNIWPRMKFINRWWT
jgi:hypothetical protein